MNATSSRSHAIFTVVVESTDGGKIRVGKLNLVDLAGSERQTKTGATGDRLKEATKINLSLTALGNVISSLVDGSSTHIPYRDSKLTRLLQNSLGGNAKTVMCANCGPADYNFDETLSTLRYANRAKNIKNTPKINEDPKDAMMREYQDEIRRLKEQLEATQRGEFIMDSDRGSHDGNFESGLYSSRERVKEVIREVRVDLTAEQLAEINQKTYEEKQQLMQRAQDDMQQLIDQNSRAAQERAQLRAAYEREVHAKRSIEDQKQMLLDKLRVSSRKIYLSCALHISMIY